MSDKMRPIDFQKLVTWIFEELTEKETILGIQENKFYYNKSNNNIAFLGEKLGSPIGPAAGPHSQLTQNIIASYLTGSRFIELKTVQILDGEDLPVSKPCIRAEDECYNVEWSTELTVRDAYDEYVKAWFLLHVLMKELSFSEERDFIFNMSVGYDLEGIKSPKISTYIEGMRNASSTKIWNECREVLKGNLDKFKNFTKEDLDKVSPTICTSITLSTLHGCPPEEIERIANYLLTEKNLHTFIKMNPTLLGEKFVRETFDTMGYDYIALNGHHFIHDLQYDDGVSMLARLKELAKTLQLKLGVKLTNTLPVKILNKELPGEEMYMSGRSLYPLTMTLASRLAKEFNGDIYISYSGGADFFNIDKIFETGICPITFATTILKPGGYERITQIAKKLEPLLNNRSEIINTELLKKVAEASITDEHHLKEAKAVESRKLSSKLPIYKCSIAPCSIGCPINQQVPQYIALVGEEKYDEAFSVIVKDNASPAITGTICNHNCQYKCTRLDYENSVQIRNIKKIAVINAQNDYIKHINPMELKSNKKVCVIGAGAAGLSVALFLRRNGVDVTVMDKRDRAYGVIEYVIPEFRISSEIIKKDFELVKSHGVKFKFGVEENFNIEELKEKYEYIVLAIGAWKPGEVSLKEGSDKTLNAIAFLEKFKANKGKVNLGKHVCVVGGGDVAMDAARAVKRTEGVESVSIVYRRTRKFMPADREEVALILSEGILIKELLSPVSLNNGKLLCEEMILGERDASGRRSPINTGTFIELDADTVIVAVGEKVDTKLFTDSGIEVDSKGLPKVNLQCETNIKNVYVAGDAKNGPSTIVQAISHGKSISKDILNKENLECDFHSIDISINENSLYERKGILMEPICCEGESKRCLGCDSICELCVDVCPNRANVVIKVKDGLIFNHEIVHLDGMCNECGNCGVFCPHTGNPYKDKVTVFWNEEDFENSTNIGFWVKDSSTGICKIRTEQGEIIECKTYEENTISKEMKNIIETCIEDYRFML